MNRRIKTYGKETRDRWRLGWSFESPDIVEFPVVPTRDKENVGPTRPPGDSKSRRALSSKPSFSENLPRAVKKAKSPNVTKSGSTPQDLVDTLLEFSVDRRIHNFSTYINDLDAKISKLGEASYSEVFLLPSTTTRDAQVLKIIPFGEDEHSCKLEDILQEVRLSRCMTTVRGFIKFHWMCVVQGAYPDMLLGAWDEWANDHECMNKRPDFYPCNQKYVVIVLEHGGRDLETFPLHTWAEAASIFWSVVEICARGEQEREFEHRDLHWGNILIKQEDDDTQWLFANLSLDGVKCRKLVVTLIDYTLSRARCDDHVGGVAYNPMSDPSLFESQGEYQFEIYRFMKSHVLECKKPWEGYSPKTTVYWLHYLVDKLLYGKGLKKPTKKRALSSRDQAAFDELQRMHRILDPRKEQDTFSDAQCLLRVR